MIKHIKGFKVFNSDWTCIGFHFEAGKTFTEDVEPKCCDSGFLKHIEKKTGRQMWWDGLSDRQKDIAMQLPNFDKDIFKEITGITVDGR